MPQRRGDRDRSSSAACTLLTEDEGARSRKTPLMERRSFTSSATAFVGALLAASAALAAVQASRAAGDAPQRCPVWAASSPAKGAASVSYAAQGVAVGPTRAMVRAHVAPVFGAAVVVQYGRGSSYLACTPVEQTGQGGARLDQSLLVKGLLPDTTYRFRVVAKTRAGVVFGGARRFRTLAAGHVPQGVEVGSVAIGGMSSDAGPRSPRPAACRRPPAELRRCLLECEPRQARSTARPPDARCEPRSPRRPARCSRR